MTDIQPSDAQQEHQIVAERREKLSQLRQLGQAYPNDFRPDAQAGALHAEHAQTSKENLDTQAITVKVAGRVLLKRVMGKASFLTLQDSSGQIQLYISRESIQPRKHRSRRLLSLQTLGHRRHSWHLWHAISYPYRGALPALRQLDLISKVASSPAR
jgi:lysyl-tRNA synthetase class II